MTTRLMLMLTMSSLLAACHGGKLPTAGSTADTGASSTAVSTPATDMSGTDGTTRDAGNTDAEPAALHTLYFDFDSSEIRPEYNGVLTAQARLLTRSTGVKLRLEGHTDERGSPEYNVGLGERRAQAVRRALMLQGVNAAQLSTLSFGEERPAVAGSTEDAYAKNRRVELVGGN